MKFYEMGPNNPPPSEEGVSHEAPNTSTPETLGAAYERAQNIANDCIKKIDPAYSVRVILATVRLRDGTTQDSTVLAFTHNEDPSLNWTMSIDPTDEAYLTERFEGIIANIVYEKSGALFTNTHDEADCVGRLDQNKLERLLSNERIKTPEEVEIIALANQATNEIRQRYGFPDTIVPDNAIHVITSNAWTRPGSAVFIEEINTIAIRETPRLQIFKAKVIHEMFHFKSQNVLPTIFNEALIEHITMQAFRLIENEPLTAEERRDAQRIQQENPTTMSADGSPLFSEDTFLAYTDHTGRIFAEKFTYREERDLFDRFIQNVALRSGGKFKSADDVFTAFLKASFSGDTSELEIIDEIYGAGTLEAMHNVGDDIALLKEILEGQRG